MKQRMLLLMTSFFALSVLGCGAQNTVTDSNVSESSEVQSAVVDSEIGDVEIPSPITEYATLEEAIEAAGFPLNAPSSVNDLEMENISVYTMDEMMIQVIYENEGDSLTLRKGVVSPGETDISGVYIDYEEETELLVDGVTIYAKGNSGYINLAVWDTEGYSYSVFSEGGLTTEEAEALILQMQEDHT